MFMRDVVLMRHVYKSDQADGAKLQKSWGKTRRRSLP